VVALAHTEAAVEAGGQRPKNWDLLMRTLSGFVSHPNVAAALVVGYGGELLTPETLRSHIEAEGYRQPAKCYFFTLSGNFEEDLATGKEIILPWLPEVDRYDRSEQPLSHLRVALQCGGSDAFSGVSGNPASGMASKLLIEHGGAAVLAETDELIGAESYVLSRVRDLDTARQFLHFVERFKERFSWHGQSAESNPSGGNKLRGLYNIVLKSLGAAKKKHAEVALDGVLEYGQQLEEGRRGYYFLDSPGNDLESIAGQVASGCNAIFFI
jgi:altronate dehydratase